MDNSYSRYKPSPAPLKAISSEIPNVPTYPKYVPFSPKEETSWYHRPLQFGKGVAKGAIGNLALIGEALGTPVGTMALRAYKGEPILPFQEPIHKKLEGWLPTPGEQDEVGRFLNTAGEFTGGMASLPVGPYGPAAKGLGLLKPFAKNILSNAGVGAAIGSVAGGLESMGEDPGTAGLAASLGVPLVALPVAKGGAKMALRPFLKRFSKEELAAGKAAEILKSQIGEKNLPKVIKNLSKPTPLGVKPLTAEAGENVGLANLHRALNLPEAAEKTALNDALLRKHLGEIGITGLEAEKTGENIRGNLSKTLEEAKTKRAKTTKPLYEKIEKVETKVPLVNSIEYLNRAGENAIGDTKKTLNYVESLLLDPSQKAQLVNFSKQYGNLGVDAQNQIKSQILPTNRPIKLENALKDINGRLGKALRAGDNNTARILEEAKEAINLDLQTVPEAQLARSTYHQLSKPVSAIEQEPLLKKFVKKDIYGENFITSPEKIPNMIFSASPRHVRAFMDKIKGHPEVLEQVRGTLSDDLLRSTELSSITSAGEHNLSYPKMIQYLKRRGKVLKEVLTPDQLKVVEDVREVLRRRNQAATLGKGVGSDTVPKATILQAIGRDSGINVAKWLPRGLSQKAASGAYDYLQGLQKQEVQNLLEKAMFDPNFASTLLMRVEDIKTPKTLNNILNILYGSNIGFQRTEEE